MSQITNTVGGLLFHVLFSLLLDFGSLFDNSSLSFSELSVPLKGMRAGSRRIGWISPNMFGV